jgi:hypothetical protein
MTGSRATTLLAALGSGRALAPRLQWLNFWWKG